MYEFTYENLVSIAGILIKEVMEERGGDRQAFAELLSGKMVPLEAYEGSGHNYDAMLVAIYKYYIDHPDSHIDEILYESLEILIQSIKSVYSFLLCHHYLVAHQEHVKRCEAPFQMDSLSLRKKFMHTVLNNEKLAGDPAIRLYLDSGRLKEMFLSEGKRIRLLQQKNVLIVLALFAVTVLIPYATLILLIALFLLLASSVATSITVTTTRVYGKTSFGKQVDLPLDSISSVDMGAFHGINIRTSSEKFSFMGIDNREEIQQTLCKLLEDLKEDPAADAANEQ